MEYLHARPGGIWWPAHPSPRLFRPPDARESRTICAAAIRPLQRAGPCGRLRRRAPAPDCLRALAWEYPPAAAGSLLQALACRERRLSHGPTGEAADIPIAFVA